MLPQVPSSPTGDAMTTSLLILAIAVIVVVIAALDAKSEGGNLD